MFPAQVLERLAEAHLPHLDVAYHLYATQGSNPRLADPRQVLLLTRVRLALDRLRAVQRLAKGIGAAQPAAQPRPASAARLIDLLLLMTPPRTDPPVEEALLLVRPDGKLAAWGGAVRDSITAKKHRFELARAWRAILALPLSDAQYHRALRAFPTAVLPHVARPLQVRT